MANLSEEEFDNIGAILQGLLDKEIIRPVSSDEPGESRCVIWSIAGQSKPLIADDLLSDIKEMAKVCEAEESEEDEG